MGLAGVFVESVAVGAEHSLVLTSTGDVWGWGNNSDMQLGIGHSVSVIVWQPQLIQSLCNKNIKQVLIADNWNMFQLMY